MSEVPEDVRRQPPTDEVVPEMVASGMGEDPGANASATSMQSEIFVAPELTEPVHMRGERLKRAGQIAGILGKVAVAAAGGLAGAAFMLNTFPYKATAGGAHFEVKGSIGRDANISANTSLGSWVFPHVDGLPVGVHVTPKDIDVLAVAKEASPNPQTYVAELQYDFREQLPKILLWLGGETVVGAAAGALAANSLRRHYTGKGRPDHPVRYYRNQLAAMTAAGAVLGGYGWASYNPDWTKDSHLTGTLAAAQAFPNQLADFYNGQSKGTDVLDSILALQTSLQQQVVEKDVPPTAFNIMQISDMHLVNNYDELEAYVEAFDVKLIINTGDEAEFGTRAEMTPEYIDAIKRLAQKVPIIWLAGNHDSPTTVEVIRSIPGVYVLGAKTFAREDGKQAVKVQAGEIDAYGLKVGALPDPRVYGGPDAYGAEDGKITDPLERAAVDAALRGVDERFDIFAAHEPVAVAELNKVLADKIRETMAGHLHEQNSDQSIQSGPNINLVEGSTGQGGLDELNRNPRPLMEFTVESVAGDCQFTKLVRVQEKRPLGSAAGANTIGSNVNTNVIYLKPQKLDAGRTCSVEQGIGEAQLVTPGTSQNPATAQADGKKTK